jgi:transcriptional regulator with XRE-family HTH domain
MAVDVGKKIVNFRRAHDITIRELADMTGLSSALISQLERGIGNPTMSALSALADALGITLQELVASQIENRDLICRKEDRATVRQDKNLLIRSVLVENAMNTSLSVMMMELQPHTSSGFDIHAEEECIFVISGTMAVVFENEEFVLNGGDSIRVLPTRQHMIRNDGETPAAAMNIKCKVQY